MKFQGGKSMYEAVHKAAQEIASGNCHHTAIGAMRTLEAILDDVFNAGVRHGMACGGCGELTCQWCQREIDRATEAP